MMAFIEIPYKLYTFRDRNVSCTSKWMYIYLILKSLPRFYYIIIENDVSLITSVFRKRLIKIYLKKWIYFKINKYFILKNH